MVAACQAAASNPNPQPRKSPRTWSKQQARLQHGMMPGNIMHTWQHKLLHANKKPKQVAGPLSLRLRHLHHPNSKVLLSHPLPSTFYSPLIRLKVRRCTSSSPPPSKCRYSRRFPTRFAQLIYPSSLPKQTIHESIFASKGNAA